MTVSTWPPHGTVIGFRQGCTSRGGCPNHGSSELLTCQEATIRRRSDREFAVLPEDQPLPRSITAVVVNVGEVHGTVWGYRRGCHDAEACPNRHRGRRTCTEARRNYVHDYQRRRLAGAGTPIAHGSERGFLAGCHDRTTCPADSVGLTCADARRAAELARARAIGVRPRLLVNAESAAEVVQHFLTSGRSQRWIAAQAAVGRETVRALAHDAQYRLIEAQTHDRLVALACETRLAENLDTSACDRKD